MHLVMRGRPSILADKGHTVELGELDVAGY